MKKLIDGNHGNKNFNKILNLFENLFQMICIMHFISNFTVKLLSRYVGK